MNNFAVSEEQQDWNLEQEHELKRVKVYELIGSRWVDQGTAFCFGQVADETNQAFLIARSERNYADIVLSTAIRSSDVYQRQQDTLIVWTEPDGVDYALSFQDPEGCAEVWNFIQDVRRHMNSSDDGLMVSSSPLLGPEASVTTSSIIRSGHLPPPQLGIISEIERAIKSLARTQPVKERICEYIQQEDYIKALIKVMHTAEDLESLQDLHALCSLMQTILMLNDHSMYEHILEDDMFFGVVGMLEYDPEFPGHKANYRDFLHNTAQFHQPIPIRDAPTQRKIHHTYRLQFLKDVVLARALDDSTFNVLTSCIIFNQIDIISHVQGDPSFLRDIVRLFVDEDMLNGGGANARRIAQVQAQQAQQLQNPQHMVISLNGHGDNITKADTVKLETDQKGGSSSPKLTNGTTEGANGRTGRWPNAYTYIPPEQLTEEDIALRREVVMLLQQLCVMGKNIQMPARIALFRTLVDRGILFAVEWAIGLPEKEDANKPVISAGGEVLTALLDHDINGVRTHVLKQVNAIEQEKAAGKKGADKAISILQLACRIMAQSKDLAVQSQVGDALKVWLDVPPNPEPAASSDVSEILGPKLPTLARKDEPNLERFLDNFYKDCLQTLLQPIINLPPCRTFQEPTLRLSREEINRFVYLCDLVHNFLQQHSFRSHFNIVSSDILASVATLLKVKDKHLRHSAFRIFRLLLKQNNPITHTQLKKLGVFKPILDLTIQESSRDSLLSCSCQEYFDFMRRENVKTLIEHIMKNHEEEIQTLAKSRLGGQRFELFIRRYEINTAPPPEESTPLKLPDDRSWSGPGRNIDSAEEDYFNGDDDESEVLPSISQQQWLPMVGNSIAMKRKRRPGIASSPKGYRPPLKTPQLNMPLVDYGEDDDELSPSEGDIKTPEASGSGSASPPELKVPELSSGPPPKRQSTDEDEDTLESLARATRGRSPSPAPELGPMRAGEKRRREDDDDEDMLKRISKSAKTPDAGNQRDTSVGMKPKNGEDPPAKKIKVKFGAVGLAVASAPSNQPTTPTSSDSSATSDTGKKDGDTG
ncbi:DUF625-domain-containing protein [Agrocybe pediades]|nr:DUF625-domain-containing protein [Agrocybe pediades]